jgi:hypothetical protein
VQEDGGTKERFVVPRAMAAFRHAELDFTPQGEFAVPAVNEVGEYVGLPKTELSFEEGNNLIGRSMGLGPVKMEIIIVEDEEREGTVSDPSMIVGHRFEQDQPGDPGHISFIARTTHGHRHVQAMDVRRDTSQTTSIGIHHMVQADINYEETADGEGEFRYSRNGGKVLGITRIEDLINPWDGQPQRAWRWVVGHPIKRSFREVRDPPLEEQEPTTTQRIMECGP